MKVRLKKRHAMFVLNFIAIAKGCGLAILFVAIYLGVGYIVEPYIPNIYCRNTDSHTIHSYRRHPAKPMNTCPPDTERFNSWVDYKIGDVAEDGW